MGEPLLSESHGYNAILHYRTSMFLLSPDILDRLKYAAWAEINSFQPETEELLRRRLRRRLRARRTVHKTFLPTEELLHLSRVFDDYADMIMRVLVSVNPHTIVKISDVKYWIACVSSLPYNILLKLVES